MLRPAAVSLAAVLLATPVIAQDAIPTVTGAGTASKAGVGNFSATLPDGSTCTANFWGGKFSVFGHSATKATTTCRNGADVRTARTVVYRRLNGTPREATLTFNDGTKIRVVIPRADDAKAP
jgi:hypothetical protein